MNNKLTYLHHSPFYNVTQKVLMPENMPKPSALPVPSRFQYVSSFIAAAQRKSKVRHDRL